LTGLIQRPLFRGKRYPLHEELPTAVAFADEGKAEEVEGFRLSEPTLSTSICRKAAELADLSARGKTAVDSETTEIRPLRCQTQNGFASADIVRERTSILSGPGVGSFSQPFQSNYTALQTQIETLCLPFLKDDDKKSKATT
jgi:hypothetical protein